MIRINLLPHREIKRKQQQKEFFIMTGAVLGLGAAAWFAVHSYLGGQLEEQNGRNNYLETEIATLDKQIDEIKKLKEQTAALLQRKKVVESLQANRAETVYLLDQLVRQLPDGVYLKSVQQRGNKVTVGGFAQSNARVSTFMRNLESSPYLEKPVLIEIKAFADKTARLSEFSLSVLLTRSKEDQAAPAKKPAAKPVASAPDVLPTTQVIAQSAPAGAPSTTAKPASARTATTTPVSSERSPVPNVTAAGATAQPR
jgi:type IV pilus assembly protein PilN